MKVKKARCKFKAEFYVEAYILAKSGFADTSIAAALKVGLPTFKNWLSYKKALKIALDRGRKDANVSGVSIFFNYVYKHLPEELMEIWQEINPEPGQTTNFEKLQDLLSGQSERGKQQLYFHALVHCNFNASEAASMVGLSKSHVTSWIRKDQEFAKLVESFHEFKKDFFEGSLVRLVKDRDSSATIFANRTINRDRGYGEKTTIDVNNTSLNVNINIEELQLPLEVRKIILEAMERLEEQKKAPLVIEHKALASPTTVIGTLNDESKN